MVVESFPDLAVNLIYTVLCLVPGFVTLKTALYVTDAAPELETFDKRLWSVIASGLTLSLLYFVYVAWASLTGSRFRVVVPVELQWTELVAAYPLLVGIAVCLGYVVGRLLGRSGSAVGSPATARQD